MIILWIRKGLGAAENAVIANCDSSARSFGTQKRIVGGISMELEGRVAKSKRLNISPRFDGGLSRVNMKTKS